MWMTLQTGGSEIITKKVAEESDVYKNRAARVPRAAFFVSLPYISRNLIALTAGPDG